MAPLSALADLLRSVLIVPMRRNVALLATCQALFMSVQAMNTSVTPLAGHMLLGPDKSLATVPVFLQHFAVMATAFPASFFMARFGRRAGFSLGAVASLTAGLVSSTALMRQDFVLLCLGSFLLGVSASFAFFYRFAAADAADAAFKPKAVSLVMAGGVFAGFLGPQVAKVSVDWLAPVQFAGIYIAMSLFAAATLLIMQALAIPAPTAEERRAEGRPFREISRQPAFIVALLAGMFGYAVMSLLMTATPLAMLGCGFGFDPIASVIQVHIIAMFLPSFFTGSLITRFGVLRVIIAGALLLLLTAVVHLAGITFWHFYVGLALLGLGWNFAFVGATSLLATTYRPAERAKVQATNDFLVYASTASAAGLSGVLNAKVGWAVVNIAALPMMTVVVLAAGWLALRQRSPSRPAPTA